MAVWEICAAVLAGSIVPCVGVCLLAGAASALAALEVLGTVTSTTLVILAEAFGRQPFIDLAIILALLTVVGSLTFARLMERDL